MRAFPGLREILSANKDFARRLEDPESKFNAHGHQFQAVFDAIGEMVKPNEKLQRKMGFQKEHKRLYPEQSLRTESGGLLVNAVRGSWFHGLCGYNLTYY